MTNWSYSDFKNRLMFFSSGIDQTTYGIEVIRKERSTKIVDFMTPRIVVLC